MVNEKLLICPVCNGNSFIMKYEATYVYSYNIDSDAPGINNTKEFLPFLFDNREQTETKQYLECTICNSKYQCFFNQTDEKIDICALQEAISSHQVQAIFYKHNNAIM